MEIAIAQPLPDPPHHQNLARPPARLHLNHGPIDLIIGVWGSDTNRATALAAARTRFSTVLDELISELRALRSPLGSAHGFKTPVARRMAAAVKPFANGFFITPMAAVAGAVADEVLAAMLAATPLPRAFVNNGGDIAVHVQSGEKLDIGIVGRPDTFATLLDRRATIDKASGIGGVATSGRHGRSLSMGIADAVTVLGRCAADADAAATIIANHVDLDAPAVARAPAQALDPDSDLGARLVVTGVGSLTNRQIALALDRGATIARDLCRRGVVMGAHLQLGAASRTTGLATAHLSNQPRVPENS